MERFSPRRLKAVETTIVIDVLSADILKTHGRLTIVQSRRAQENLQLLQYQILVYWDGDIHAMNEYLEQSKLKKVDTAFFEAYLFFQAFQL